MKNLLKSDDGYEVAPPDLPPILYLDVNIEGEASAKLMLFEGDNVDLVVETFSQYYDLS